ncbi:membrane alanyl aminopeptidase domain protein [Propionibacterium acidifaciens F0233]|uniref:Membrane alanyl aminopeptidase domain protein n=1 Tax=Propionibacterium acidifaciens F0233 TaxID=553198 RepID=U2RI02_9ACTN|nr:membrane alanyl aminopeptidase domain protein [Propionibacterium acidifaciens F0233]
MNPANITRDEAAARSAALSTTSYEVTVDLTGHGVGAVELPEPEETFLSTSTVRFTSTGTSTWIDLIADEVVSAALDGEALDPADFAGSRLPLEPGAGEHELTVTAICRYSRTGEGLHRFVDPADGRVYLYTQFETADARRMYACFEQPDLKATFRLVVRAPAGWTVRSNSPAPEPFGPDPIGAMIWDFPRPRASPRTSRRSSPASTTSTTARSSRPRARWTPTSSAAPRWRPTWTPSASARRSSAASRSTSRTSAARTPSTSTTSCSSPSTTPAPWRTRAP